MRSPIRPAALLATALCAVLIAGALAGCGGGSRHRRSRHHEIHAAAQAVDIYSSLPLSGPSAGAGRSIKMGIRLALSQAGRRAGSFIVQYHSLNDARPGRGAWDAAQTAAGARKVATDPAAIAYIGDFESAATEVSLPILNEAGIPQISPWSPYVGLTQSVLGVTAPGEPARYFPSGARTLLRIAPDDAVQTAAMLLAFHDGGCSRLAVLRSTGASGYGRELAALLDVQSPRYGVRIVSHATLGSAESSLRRYLLSLRAALTECVAYVGSASQTVPMVLGAVHAELPRAGMIASDRVCSAAADQSPLRTALASVTGGRLECMRPAVPSGVPAQSRFAADWRRAYGSRRPPSPWSAFGYAAMQLTLNAIAGLGSQGDDRRALLRALFAASPRGTVLGTFGFFSSGDVTLRSYGLYQLRAAGPPVLYRVLEPPPASAYLS